MVVEDDGEITLGAQPAGFSNTQTSWLTQGGNSSAHVPRTAGTNAGDEKTPARTCSLKMEDPDRGVLHIGDATFDVTATGKTPVTLHNWAHRIKNLIAATRDDPKELEKAISGSMDPFLEAVIDKVDVTELSKNTTVSVPGSPASPNGRNIHMDLS